MHVTVGICTWNRAALLDMTLQSMAALEIPAGVTWEILVADNNSTDETQEVVRRHQSRLPLRSLFVPQQGKSYAINAAVEAIDSDLILWTDDDVLVDPRWLAAHVVAAHKWPDASFFGGPILPVFEVDPPAWVGEGWKTISGAFAARELGQAPFELNRVDLPFGANVAIRTQVQKKYLYNPKLGRRAGLLLAGEETDLLHRLLDDGHKGMWVPGASLQHYITRDRLTLDYLRRCFFGLGQSKLEESAGRWGKGSRLSVMAGSWWGALRSERKCRRALRRGNIAQWVKYVARASYRWGKLDAAWTLLPPGWKPEPLVAHYKLREERRVPVSDTAPVSENASHSPTRAAA